MKTENFSFPTPLPDPWVLFYPKAGDLPFSILPGREATHMYPITRPAAAISGSQALFFDGWLYNQKDLQAELEAGAPPESIASLLLLAYRRWGDEFLSHLKGCFSLVLHDLERESFLAVRDAMGIVPLFYAETGAGIFFSQSIPSLRAQDGVSRQVNRIALAEGLSMRWGAKDETYFQDIHRLPPGHCLRIVQRRQQIERYWCPLPPDGNVTWIRHEVNEQFEALLDRTTADLLGFGPAAIYLSGGLDSVTVAAIASALASQRGERPPHAYSLKFPNIGELEEPVQRGVAGGLGLPLYLTTLGEASGPQGLFRAAIEMNRSWPAPLMNLWRPAYNSLAARALADGCRVIMTGTGGDEWLGLSPFYSADLIRSGNLRGLLRMIQGMNASYPFPLKTHIYNALWRYGGRPVVANTFAAGLNKVWPQKLRDHRRKIARSFLPEWFHPEREIENAIAQRIEQEIEEGLKRILPKSYYIHETENVFDHVIVSLDMEEEYENSRRVGMPILGLYQHQELVDFLFRVHPEVLNTGKAYKGLVRGIMERRFPGLGLDRQKKIGATDNFREIVLGEVKPVWDELGGVKSLARLGLLQEQEAATFFDKTLKNPPLSNRPVWMLWHLANYESWVRDVDFT